MRLGWTFWDVLTNLEDLDCFPSPLRPFSPIIGSLKKTRDGQTYGPTDGRPSYRDARTHLKINWDSLKQTV